MCVNEMWIERAKLANQAMLESERTRPENMLHRHWDRPPLPKVLGCPIVAAAKHSDLAAGFDKPSAKAWHRFKKPSGHTRNRCREYRYTEFALPVGVR